MVEQYPISQESRFHRGEIKEAVSTLGKYGDSGRILAELLLSTAKNHSDYRDSLNTPLVRSIKELNQSMREKLAEGDFDYVVENSDDFPPNLDCETAYALYEAGHGERVRDNIKRFYTLDVRVFDKVIYPHIENKSGGSYKIDYNKLNNFCKENSGRFVNQSDIIIYLIEHGEEGGHEINLKNFYGLNKVAAQKIGYKYLLSHSYKKEPREYYDEKKLKYIFTGLDEESLKEMLNEVTPSNARNLKNIIQWFTLDKNAFNHIRNKYLECKELGYFADVDCNDIKEAIINNIELFKGLDVEDAKLLIENGYGEVVVRHPEHYGLTKEK